MTDTTPQTFTTSLTVQEIEDRLSSLEKFDVKEKTQDAITVNVGSAFKYRFLGVYATQDYQAPMQIEATDNGDGTTTVTLTERGLEGTLFTTGKSDQFFKDAFDTVQTELGG